MQRLDGDISVTSVEKFKKLVDEYGSHITERMQDPVFFIDEIAGIGPTNAKMNEYQAEWVNLIHENKRVNITAYRSSGKTECLLVSYPIFKAFTTSNWTGIVVSEKEKNAIEILTRIRKKIESNPILAKSMPKNKSIAWTKSDINLSNGSRILCMPYTDRMRGWHVNWVGFDEAGEYRDLDVFESNAYSITQAHNGDVVVVGTPKSELDLLHTLRKNIQWESKIYAADTKWKDGNILWDIRYPKMSLDKKKKEVNNNLKFTREFLCKVLSSGDELFPYGVIECSFDYESSFEKRYFEDYTYYIGIDFAISGASGADWSAYAVMCQDNKTDVVRLINLERYKGLSYPAQKLRIHQLDQMYKPRKIIVDESLFGKTFIQEMRQKHVPVTGFKFQHKRQELLEVFRDAFDTNLYDYKDKDGNPVPLSMAERKFFINYHPQDPKCVKIVDELVKELMGFGVVVRRGQKRDMVGSIKFESVRAHDDLVMACAMAYWSVREHGRVNFFAYRGSEEEKTKFFIR